MNNNVYLNEIIEAWKEIRQYTFDLLDVLTSEQLEKELPRPDLDTFGKHFQELADVQECYIEAVKSKKLDFSSISNKINYDLVGSKNKLKEYLKQKDQEMFEVLSDIDTNIVIQWYGDDEPTIVEHISRLIRHEQLHLGQFVAYGYMLGVKFPKSWIEAWSLPKKKGNLYVN